MRKYAELTDYELQILAHGANAAIQSECLGGTDHATLMGTCKELERRGYKVSGTEELHFEPPKKIEIHPATQEANRIMKETLHIHVSLHDNGLIKVNHDHDLTTSDLQTALEEAYIAGRTKGRRD